MVLICVDLVVISGDLVVISKQIHLKLSFMGSLWEVGYVCNVGLTSLKPKDLSNSTAALVNAQTN